MDERHVLFQGELQLMDWGVSRASGAWVKFWVHEEDLESFKLLQTRTGKQVGQRLGVVMVQIGDGEAVVEHAPAPAPPTSRPYRKPTLGDNAMTAVRWCKSDVFRKWLSSHLGVILKTEDDAKQAILSMCDVDERHGQEASRKHLDTDPHCAAKWNEEVRIPFRDYLKEEGLEP